MVPEDGSVISRSSVERPGLAVHRQHTTTGADTGIVIITDFNNIARYMAKPFGTHAEVHGLRFQQFRFRSATARRGAPAPAGTAKGIHLRDVTTVTGNGLRVLHKLCCRLQPLCPGQSSSPQQHYGGPSGR